MSAKQLYTLCYKKLWPLLFFGVLFSALYASADVYLIRLIKYLLDDGFTNQEKGFLSILPFYLIALFSVRSLSAFLSQYSLSLSSAHSRLLLREKLFNKVMKAPSHFYKKLSTGDIIHHCVYAPEQFSQLSSWALATLARETITVFGLLVVMFLSSPIFTFLYLLSAPFVFFLLRLVSHSTAKSQKSLEKTTEKISSSLQQLIQSEQTIKSFNTQEFELKRILSLSESNAQHEKKHCKALYLGAASIQIIAGLTMTSIIFLALKPNFSNISAGDFTCLITAILALLRPLKQLSELSGTWQKILRHKEQITEVLKWPEEEKKQRKEGSQKTPWVFEESITFDKVSFCYEGSNAENILDQVSFTIKKGQSIAIIGRSGSGKTTLLSLLLNFYQPTSGKIFIDKCDHQQFDLQTLRQHLSLVSQESEIFNRSVYENIAYGDQYVNRSKAKKFAQLACANNFIEQLESGYHTVLGEKGSRLSGGQKQRIALARALYKNAPILLLDEATSALDAESEEMVQKALEISTGETTTLIIAHKMKTILKADSILVLDQGKVVQSGTHRELIKQKGLYATLYAKNFEEHLELSNKQEIL